MRNLSPRSKLNHYYHEGCCHGQLDAIYGQIARLEQQNGYKVDLLLICGDFQAIRNSRDLQCMAVPNKYKELGEFHKYYAGEKIAPILTIVIGGNHEASNYMWELYHGGWLAPNIYFLGHAGCVQVNGIRIAGASGIFKGHDFRTGHYERVPYDQSAMRSIYHTREYDIRRLSLANIMLSHDWPQSIEHHGDVGGLIRRKRFFEADIRSGKLGSPPLIGLLQAIQPKWWFSAHLHVRFEATYAHAAPVTAGNQLPSGILPSAVHNPDEIAIDEEDDEAGPSTSSAPAPEIINPEEILLDDEEDFEPVPKPVIPLPSVETKFLALDKCLPRREFLEVIEIDTPSSTKPSGTEQSATDKVIFTYDPEWLAINRAFHPLFSTTWKQPTFPPEDEARALVAKELEWVQANLQKQEGALIPVGNTQTFVVTAPGPCAETENPPLKFQQPPHYPNPQTVAFCSMLGIEDKINPTSPA
ncbi:DBR1-domain-containing protein [Coprinopsis marcescibilis]|uniref:DBR1-domain-containing protein n=1 Tax=Coprinopsis marcescibilis TaxID=230819 RepID=A0A5C3KFD9_COPMA|nr:DBR1-domain-containing protein [Coprinopsis marcescibilis]